MKEERYLRRDSHINKAFNLTYASWLILPRTLLMDMPTQWQEKFVKLLDEYNESVADLAPDYESGKFTKLPDIYCNYRHTQHMDVCDIRCFSQSTLMENLWKLYKLETYNISNGN